ncbi:MAG: fucose isomerase, partial [Eubacterium sp.]|nr:fucose isomerase [Eubacterium sp.]
MIKKVLDIKLNVKPVFIMFAHKYYFEGPCRMTGGEALQPGFDSIVNGAIFNGTMEGINFSMPDCVNVMEPVFMEPTCDWDIKDAYF